MKLEFHNGACLESKRKLDVNREINLSREIWFKASRLVDGFVSDFRYIFSRVYNFLSSKCHGRGILVNLGEFR